MFTAHPTTETSEVPTGSDGLWASTFGVWRTWQQLFVLATVSILLAAFSVQTGNAAVIVLQRSQEVRTSAFLTSVSDQATGLGGESLAVGINQELQQGASSLSAALNVTGVDTIDGFSGSGEVSVTLVSPIESSGTVADGEFQLDFRVEEETNFEFNVTPVDPGAYQTIEDPDCPVCTVSFGVGVAYSLNGPNTNIDQFNDGSSGFIEQLEPGDYSLFVRGFAAGVPGFSTSHSLNYNFSGTYTPMEVEFTWSNPAGGQLGVASNWENNAVPGPEDDALFDLADTYTVTIDDNAPAGINSAKIEAGQVTFEFDGDALGVGTLTVGGAGNPAQLALSGTDEIIASSITAAVVSAGPSQLHEESEEHDSAGHVPTEEVFVLPQGVLKVISEGGILDLDVTDEVVVEGTMEIRDNGRVESGRLIIGDEGREGTVTVVSSDADRLARIAAGNAVLGDDQDFGIVDGGKGSLEIGANAEAVFAKLIVGDGGEGQITVKDGGRLDVLGEMILADNIGAMGQVDVEGNSRVSVGGKITVGSFAAAAAAFELDSTMNIFDTAQVDAAAGLDVGIFGLVVVQGRDEIANATLTLSGDLLMSDNATGVVLAEGGRLEIPEATHVNITLGVDSQLILASEFALADRPSGVNLHETSTLAVQIGTTPSAPDRVAKVEVYEGSILNATSIQVGSGPFIAGKLIVDTRNTGIDAQVRAETIDVDRLGEFTVANGASVFLGSREAIVGAIFNGTGTSQTDFANKVIVLTGGTLNFAGMVEVGGALVIDDGGHINTGSSPGTGTLVGDFLLQPGGTWTVEVAGLTPGDEYDQLIVTGNATIGGTVVFEFLDGFAPQQGQVFDFLAVTGETDLSGAVFEVRNLAPGFQFDVTATTGGFQMVALTGGTFVPEPNTVVLASLGLLGVLQLRRARLLGRPLSRGATLIGTTCETTLVRTKWVRTTGNRKTWSNSAIWNRLFPSLVGTCRSP